MTMIERIWAPGRWAADTSSDAFGALHDNQASVRFVKAVPQLEIVMRNATKLIASCAVLMAAGASFSAHAGGNVSWSVTFSSPQPVYYEPAPVYVQPAPVYYQPAPVYYQPAPVYVRPAPVVVYRPPVFVQPAPVVYPQPQYWGPGWRGHRGHGHHRGHDDHGGRGRVVLRVNG
jgi:PXPV repeat (3 copies)